MKAILLVAKSVLPILLLCLSMNAAASSQSILNNIRRVQNSEDQSRKIQYAKSQQSEKRQVINRIFLQFVGSPIVGSVENGGDCNGNLGVRLQNGLQCELTVQKGVRAMNSDYSIECIDKGQQATVERTIGSVNIQEFDFFSECRPR